ncbi:MAG: DUF4253 domain-containing protein [Candidatus Melainabacteria bacterium]|nr:DUF4253 domain-containing protein [Candidatus Melainabacteria bacterium]
MANSQSAEELAKQSGFPLEVIKLIQGFLKPEKYFCTPSDDEMSELKLPRYCSSQDGFLSKEEKENYTEIVKQYPELKPIVEGELQFYMSSDERMSTAEIVKQKLSEEKKLDPEFDGLGLEYLIRDFEGSRNPANQFEEFAKNLNELGYAYSKILSFVEGFRFKSRKEAEAFLIQHGVIFSHHVSLVLFEEEAQTFELHSGESAFNPEMKNVHLALDTQLIPGQSTPGFITHLKRGVTQRVPPGSTVSKISFNHWKVDAPECYTARLHKRLAFISKTRDKFELIRSLGTYAPNYSITNEMVLDQLKSWDKKYGVKVLSAGGDCIEIELENLPNDMSALCTESFHFCGELELTDDENMNAAIMRDLAARIRKSKKMNFWWD